MIKIKSYDKLIIGSYKRINRGIYYDENLNLYNIEFLNEILKYFEHCEDFERCIKIKNVINLRTNHILKYSNK